MNLTTDEFADVVSALQLNPEGEGDKRRANRITHECEVVMTPGGEPHNKAPLKVRVKDMSPRGMCLVHSSAMTRGSTFVVRLDRAGREPVDILCTVAYSRRVKTSVYHIGAEFTCVLNGRPSRGTGDPPVFRRP